VDERVFRLHAEHEARNWWFVAKNRIILSLLDRFAPGAPVGKLRACDIGCGSGGLLAPLSERYDAVGVDSLPLALDYCRERGLKAVSGRLPDQIPLEPGSFDIVVASEVIEHVPDDLASVGTLAGLLRPNGILVCTVPANQWMWSVHDERNHHCRRYSRSAFQSLFRGAPLAPERLSYYNFGLFPLMAAVRVASRVLRLDRTGAEYKAPPQPFNALFRALFESEKHVLARSSLPIGGSLIGVHRRLDAPAPAPSRPHGSSGNSSAYRGE
jgi:SAM-dependent methyltransferase